MGTVDSRQENLEEGAASAVRAGDESAFTALAMRYRPELQLHCYRMLGSFDDSEDLVQETFMRAWRKRASFEGRSTFRAWLYRIATNACLDFLDKNRRRIMESVAPARSTEGTATPPPHVPWLQPYPDRLLETIASLDAAPDARLIARENIELAFMVAIQFLPARQRAVLILCDVLDWSAKEAAELLESSVASVNGALQRARATLRQYQRPHRAVSTSGLTPAEAERRLLERYVAATERNDPAAIVDLLREDVRSSMPPHPATYAGRDAVVGSWVEGGFGSPSLGEFRCVVTRANRMPAVACYLRAPGENVYRALVIDVLEIEDGTIAEITAFSLETMYEEFGLPAAL